MKTLIQIFVIAMFGIEICSPFFLGYLNSKQKIKKIYSAQEVKTEKEIVVTTNLHTVKNLDLIDFTGNNYSDSKTIKIKE